MSQLTLSRREYLKVTGAIVLAGGLELGLTPSASAQESTAAPDSQDSTSDLSPGEQAEYIYCFAKEFGEKSDPYGHKYSKSGIITPLEFLAEHPGLIHPEAKQQVTILSDSKGSHSSLEVYIESGEQTRNQIRLMEWFGIVDNRYCLDPGSRLLYVGSEKINDPPAEYYHQIFGVVYAFLQNLNPKPNPQSPFQREFEVGKDHPTAYVSHMYAKHFLVERNGTSYARHQVETVKFEGNALDVSDPRFFKLEITTDNPIFEIIESDPLRGRCTTKFLASERDRYTWERLPT